MDDFAGECKTCGSDCPSGQYAFECGGLASGRCVNCAVCGAGWYTDGCGGAQPGWCTTCPKCVSGKVNVGCGGVSPGTCEVSTSELDASDLPRILSPILIWLAIVIPCVYCVCKQKQNQRQRAMAIALREEKLQQRTCASSTARPASKSEFDRDSRGLGPAVLCRAGPSKNGRIFLENRKSRRANLQVCCRRDELGPATPTSRRPL